MDACLCRLRRAQVSARLQRTSTTSTPTPPRAARCSCSNPDRRTSFDKFNPYTIKGQSPAGLTTLMFEIARACAPATSRTRCTACSPRRCRSPPDKSSITFRINPKARFNNGDPVTAADVKHSFEMLTSKAAAPATRTQLRRRARARRCSTSARSASTSRSAPPTRSSTSAACPVFSPQVGAGRRRQAEEVRRDRQRVPDHHAARTRSAPSMRRGASSSTAIPNYWARDLGVSPRPVQLRPRRLPLLPGQRDRDRGVQGRRVRLPDGVLGAALGAPAPGAKWDDGRIIKEEFPTGFGTGLAGVLLQPAPAAVPGSPRARGARAHLRLRSRSTSTSSTSARTACSPTPSSRPTGCRRPAELALLEPFRGELPPAMFGPAWQDPRTDTRARTRCATTSRRRASCSRRRAGRSTPTACCATPRASPSSSSASRPARRRPARGRLPAQPRASSASSSSPRLVDFALYRKRLETFDFDMINIKTRRLRAAQRRRPQGAVRQHGSATSRHPTTTRGVKSQAVDPLLERMDKAKTHGRAARRARARSTGSFMHEHYAGARPLRAARTACRTGTSSASRRRCPKYYTIDRPPATGCSGR